MVTGALALAISLAGCKSKDDVRTEEETAPQLASSIQMSDTHAAKQLVSGLSSLENGGWRWSARKFSIMLGVPSDASARGAKLQMKFSLLDGIYKKTGPITLSASVEGTALPPMPLNAPGTFNYEADVPASSLQGTAVQVNFELSKAVPPGPVDARELGLIVFSAGLTAK